MDRLGMEEGEPIEHSLVSRAIENAQGRVEGHNFDIRKHLLEYDDVMNKQREVIYKQRRGFLAGENLKEEILEIVEMDVKDELQTYSFDPAKVKFHRGSALAAINGDTGKYGVSAVEQLINSLDNDLDPPKRDFDKPFLMGIKSVFSIGGRGTVATGTIVQGSVKVGDALELVGMRRELKPIKTACTGIEMFNKKLERGEPGDDCGVLLRGIKKDDIRRGQVLCHPGSVAPKNHIKASVYLLSHEEGGREKGFKSGYRPQFYFRTADVTGSITLPSDVEIAVPGDNLEIESNLILPIAINKGDAFSIREGGKTVGHGIVSEILN